MATVAGLFNTRAEAQSAIEQLRRGGVDINDISVAMQDRTETREIAAETGAGAGALGGAVAGGILGGVLGIVIGAGAILIPGVGPIVAAGPIAAGITGLLAGGATGGIAGALINAGVPHEEAEVYSTGLTRGGVVVTANVDATHAPMARQILDDSGALDVNATGSRFSSDENYRLGEANTDVARAREANVPEATGVNASAMAVGDAVATSFDPAPVPTPTTGPTYYEESRPIPPAPQETQADVAATETAYRTGATGRETFGQGIIETPAPSQPTTAYTFEQSSNAPQMPDQPTTAFRGGEQVYTAETFRDGGTMAHPAIGARTAQPSFDPGETRAMPTQGGDPNANTDKRAQSGQEYQATGSGVQTGTGVTTPNEPWTESESVRDYEHLEETDPPPAGRERDFPQRA